MSLEFNLEQFAYAAGEYLEAKKAETKARERYEGVSWGYHGNAYFENIDRAKTRMAEAFRKSLKSALEEVQNGNS